MAKGEYKTKLDFREIYKWIVSPLVAKRIGVSANLDGVFWVSCNFSPNEQALLVETASELDAFKFQSAK